MADQPRMQVQSDFRIKPPPTNSSLRTDVQNELINKRQCVYQSYDCSQLSIENYKYCLKHILHDKTAPFKQCGYVYTNNGKRCNLPAPKGDRKDYGYCSEHALKTALTRNRRAPPPRTAEVLLSSISHYVSNKRSRTSSSGSSHPSEEYFQTTEENDLGCTKSMDPFEVDANVIYESSCNNILDVCSESESDVEAADFSSVWHDYDGDSSDNESIDSEQEDVLKHANVFTAEEITLVTRDKLIRLQSLYIEQYRHLQYILKERRRRYLHFLKREKETCCNIYNQVRDNPKEQRLYKKLKAYNKYQKTCGYEAILNKRLHELRTKINDGIQHRPHSFVKCLFTEGGVKCGEKALPLAKHCRKHILEDQNQVLFRACGKAKADIECSTPVEAIFDDATCKLHMDIPPIRSYSKPRKDSESDLDDSFDNVSFAPETMCTNMKTELEDYNLQEIPKMESLPSQLFEDSDVELSYMPKEKIDSNHKNSSINVQFANQDDTQSSTETVTDMVQIHSDSSNFNLDDTITELGIPHEESRAIQVK
ncbi:KAT8 regulatory NSL complex subunit 2-like isoform X2 [Aethina tumida]|uniref:KAT8 regulatory NSL complex subunit 2-like isoform X2 n=1 Tax=Aethina tumida TaxID=116153 RepID=UPI0021487700|nr:KAT8 regulatory NSL complex subunit 2-like isoform X2 [Aethina tumida]